MKHAAAVTVSRPLLFWAVWLVLVATVPVYVLVLGAGAWRGNNAPDATLPIMFFVGLVELGVATVVRWFILPRLEEVQKKLVAMIVGLALCEGPVFYSLLLFPRNQPETRMVMVALCLVCMLQFAPFYARESERHSFRSEPARP